MISFIIGYKNLLRVRKKTTEDFFEMMEYHLRMNRGLECLICDYGSDDGIKDYLTSYRSKFVPVETRSDQYLNLPKCLNKGAASSANSIVAPISTDFRFDQKLVNGVVELFQILGEIILRPLCVKLNKEGKLKDTTYSPYALLKKNILLSGGWDERMYGWGKEDNDILERIYRYQDLLEIRVRNLFYKHIWHDDSFRLQYDNINFAKNHNAKIMIENILNNGKNIINSYWKLGD